jgi:hypothetical protein
MVDILGTPRLVAPERGIYLMRAVPLEEPEASARAAPRPRRKDKSSGAA